MSPLLTATLLDRLDRLQRVAWQLDPVPTKSDVGPGVVYGLLIFGLVAATLLLWLSLRKQLRKVRFDSDGLADAGPATPSDQPTPDRRPDR